MTESRPALRGVLGLGVLAMAVCCGVPVLLAAGSAVTLAGVGFRSWLLILAGGAGALLGVIQYRRRKACRVGDHPDSSMTGRS